MLTSTRHSQTQADLLLKWGTKQMVEKDKQRMNKKTRSCEAGTGRERQPSNACQNQNL
jgi:hypothetical protein